MEFLYCKSYDEWQQKEETVLKSCFRSRQTFDSSLYMCPAVHSVIMSMLESSSDIGSKRLHLPFLKLCREHTIAN